MDKMRHFYFYLADRFGFDPDPSDDRNIDRNDWGDR